MPRAMSAVPMLRGLAQSKGSEAESVDVRDAAAIPRRVLKGGSYACAENYCRRYRPAAWPTRSTPEPTTLGFRCVVRPTM